MSAENGHLADEDESYYVSMTDLMVGVIFVFVIILMYFALRFQEAEAVQVEQNNELKRSQEARKELLEDIQKSLEEQGVQVAIDVDNGILHLPENVLFGSGQAQVSDAGRQALRVLSGSLVRILPCYTPAADPAACDGRIPAQIDSLFIEGHTDDRPVSASNPIGNNWRLSAERAIATFRELQAAEPNLDELKNYSGQRLFSISGYSEYRPRQPNDTEEGRRANRRIDLRVLMQPPTAGDAASVDISPMGAGEP